MAKKPCKPKPKRISKADLAAFNKVLAEAQQSLANRMAKDALSLYAPVYANPAQVLTSVIIK